MAMTRADFETVARTVRVALEHTETQQGRGRGIVLGMAAAFAKDFRRTSRAFQPARFLTACGLDAAEVESITSRFGMFS